MTIDELKIRLGIDPNDINAVRDSKLAAELEDAIAYAMEWCNNPFVGGIPAGVKRAIVMLVKSNAESRNVQSQRLGDMSKSFFEGGSMKAIHDELRPFKKVRFT